MPDQIVSTKYQKQFVPEKISFRVKKYQDLQKAKYQDRLWLNDYQYDLYKAAVSGLDAYSTPRILRMSYNEKRRIINFHDRAQRILNLWKQNIVNQLFEQICSLPFNKFPQNPFDIIFKDTKMSVDKFGKSTDQTFQCTISFKQLNINRRQIIQKLIQEKIFPENFFELNKPVW